jgi:hypothetical protein
MVINDERRTWRVDLVRHSKWVFWMLVKPAKEGITTIRYI